MQSQLHLWETAPEGVVDLLSGQEQESSVPPDYGQGGQESRDGMLLDVRSGDTEATDRNFKFLGRVRTPIGIGLSIGVGISGILVVHTTKDIDKDKLQGTNWRGGPCFHQIYALEEIENE